MERQREEASSNDSTSNGSYDHYTDNDNSSIKSSDDEGNSTVAGLQEHRAGLSSDEVPQSIDTTPIEPPWMNATVDEDDYDADHDDDAVSTQERITTAPLQMQGGGIPVAETVIEEDMEEGLDDLEQP